MPRPTQLRGTCGHCETPQILRQGAIVGLHKIAVRVGKEWTKETCPGAGLPALCRCAEHVERDGVRKGRVGVRWVRCDVNLSELQDAH